MAEVHTHAWEIKKGGGGKKYTRLHLFFTASPTSDRLASDKGKARLRGTAEEILRRNVAEHPIVAGNEIRAAHASQPRRGR